MAQTCWVLTVSASTQTCLQNELLRNRHGMTTVIIAHRLQTVRNADSIFVLQKGEVVENGSHDELVRLDGQYKRMIDRVDSMEHLPD